MIRVLYSEAIENTALTCEQLEHSLPAERVRIQLVYFHERLKFIDVHSEFEICFSCLKTIEN